MSYIDGNNQIMSKTTLKKYLSGLEKEEIIQVILDLYDARKEAKEYLEYFVSPDEEKKLEECKNIIINEFHPKRGIGKCRFSVCRKAISNYKKLHPSPENLGDLMICLVEQACLFTYEYGDMSEQFYISVENNFTAAMRHLSKNGIVSLFDKRIKVILAHAGVCGYGFCDSMPDIYKEYAGVG